MRQENRWLIVVCSAAILLVLFYPQLGQLTVEKQTVCLNEPFDVNLSFRYNGPHTVEGWDWEVWLTTDSWTEGVKTKIASGRVDETVWSAWTHEIATYSTTATLEITRDDLERLGYDLSGDAVNTKLWARIYVGSKRYGGSVPITVSLTEYQPPDADDDEVHIGTLPETIGGWMEYVVVRLTDPVVAAVVGLLIIVGAVALTGRRRLRL